MTKPLDRFALLETFVRIAERGSISAAGRDLGLSQGSASRHLMALENRLGVQLAQRSTHSLALTEAGRGLLVDARDLLSQWDALEEKYAPESGTLRGPLRVVAPVALGQLHLADIALEFQLRHPQVVVHWHLDDAPIRFSEIGCDCWIKVGPVPDDRLVVRPLGQVERLVVASPEIAQGLAGKTPKTVEGVPFATLTPYEGSRITLRNDKGAGCELPVSETLATNNIMSLKRAVARGIGAAILPRWLIAAELERGDLVDVFPTWRAARLDLNIAYLPSSYRPKRLSAFLTMLEDGIKRLPGIEPASRATGD